MHQLAHCAQQLEEKDILVEIIVVAIRKCPSRQIIQIQVNHKAIKSEKKKKNPQNENKVPPNYQKKIALKKGKLEEKENTLRSS